MKGTRRMSLNYKRVDFWGFDYEIEDLFGHATLYIYQSEYDNHRLFRYIDEEHGIDGGGWFELKDAKKNFKKQIEKLVA